MRPLKFRQWEKGRFHYWGFLGEGIFIGPINPTSPSQQFTGLLDRSSQEIWEGDIITFDVREGAAGERAYYNQKGPVKCLHLGYLEIGGFISHYYNLKVIGNIYENPELLEERK